MHNVYEDSTECSLTYLVAFLLAQPSLICGEEQERRRVAVYSFDGFEVSDDASNHWILERRFILREYTRQFLQAFILVELHEVRVLALEHLHKVRIALQEKTLFKMSPPLLSFTIVWSKSR